MGLMLPQRLIFTGLTLSPKPKFHGIDASPNLSLVGLMLSNKSSSHGVDVLPQLYILRFSGGGVFMMVYSPKEIAKTIVDFFICMLY